VAAIGQIIQTLAEAAEELTTQQADGSHAEETSAQAQGCRLAAGK